VLGLALVSTAMGAPVAQAFDREGWIDSMAKRSKITADALDKAVINSHYYDLYGRAGMPYQGNLETRLGESLAKGNKPTITGSRATIVRNRFVATGLRAKLMPSFVKGLGVGRKIAGAGVGGVLIWQIGNLLHAEVKRPEPATGTIVDTELEYTGPPGGPQPCVTSSGGVGVSTNVTQCASQYAVTVPANVWAVAIHKSDGNRYWTSVSWEPLVDFESTWTRVVWILGSGTGCPDNPNFVSPTRLNGEGLTKSSRLITQSCRGQVYAVDSSGVETQLSQTWGQQERFAATWKPDAGMDFSPGDIEKIASGPGPSGSDKVTTPPDPAPPVSEAGPKIREAYGEDGAKAERQREQVEQIAGQIGEIGDALNEPGEAPEVDPDGLEVGTLLLPLPLPNETSVSYRQRLQDRGHLGTITTTHVSTDAGNPDKGPDALLATTPAQGTKIMTDTPVQITANPVDWPFPGDGTTGGPGGPGTPGTPGAPPTGGGGCTRPPIRGFDLPGLAEIPRVIPFGIPFWIADALDGFVTSTGAPEFDVEMPGGIDALHIDLAWLTPQVQAVRPIVLICAAIGMLVSLLNLLGRFWIDRKAEAEARV
jgi:hypothetical protein